MGDSNEKQVAEAQVAVQRMEGGIPVLTFSREQVDLIKRTLAKGATDDELALFLYTAKRLGADPLAHQIHFVKSNTKDGPKASFQTSIDWYRLTADRTRKYAGNDDPTFDNEDEPRRASVTVYKIVDGQRCPFTATARWAQYYPGETQGFMWKKMPHLMLGKCAEALALRKAFPAELAGTYIQEEMDQATEAQQAKPPIPEVKPKSEVERSSVVLEYEAGIVDKVSKQEVKTGDGTKVKYLVYAKDGARYETTSKELAEKSDGLRKSGSIVRFTFSSSSYGKTLREIDAESQPVGA